MAFEKYEDQYYNIQNQPSLEALAPRVFGI